MRGLASPSCFHCGRSDLTGPRGAPPKRFPPRSCGGPLRNGGRSLLGLSGGLNGLCGALPKRLSPRSCPGPGRNAGRSLRGLKGLRSPLPKRSPPRSCLGPPRNAGLSPVGLNGARAVLPKRFSPRSCGGRVRNSGRSPRGLKGGRFELSERDPSRPDGLGPRNSGRLWDAPRNSRSRGCHSLFGPRSSCFHRGLSPRASGLGGRRSKRLSRDAVPRSGPAPRSVVSRRAGRLNSRLGGRSKLLSPLFSTRCFAAGPLLRASAQL